LSLPADSDHGVSAASKRALYDGLCLNAFLVGLRDPLRTVIRARNPTTIETAYEWCQAEQSFIYQNQIAEQ